MLHKKVCGALHECHSRQSRLSSLLLVVFALLSVFAIGLKATAPAYAAGQQLHCFSSPGACGYPDPTYHTAGVNDCSSLPNFSFSSTPPGTYYSGTGNLLEIVSNNVTISNLNMGNVNIYVSDVDNFTLNNVCINANGLGNEGASAIVVSANSHNTVIENSTISGANDTDQALGTAIIDYGPNTSIQGNYIYNVGTGVTMDAQGTIKDNYMLVNSVPTGEHDEDVYLSDATVTIDNNVLLNQEDQTAAVFGNTNGGSGGACDNQLTITNNLMAGGDYVLYPCGNATSVGTSTSDIENNAFARCDGGTNVSPPGDAGACPSGADTNGYFPFGGTYGLTAYYFPGTGQIWCGNHWDDTGAYISSDGSAGSACSTPGSGGSTSGSGSNGASGSASNAASKAPDTGFGSPATHTLAALLIFCAAALLLAAISQILARRTTSGKSSN